MNFRTKLAVFVVLLVTLVHCGNALEINEVFHSRSEEGSKYALEDGPYGGNGGSAWTDGDATHLNGNITAMEIRSGDRIDSIRTRYGEVWSDQHGDSGGHLNLIELADGDEIWAISGRSGSRVDMLEFITHLGIYGPYGGSGGTEFTSSYPDCYLSYFSGNAGEELDSLTFHYECP